LVDSAESMMMHGLANPKQSVLLLEMTDSVVRHLVSSRPGHQLFYPANHF